LFGWQNFLHAHQKSLYLSDLSGYTDNGTDQGYYCMSGSEKEQRGMHFSPFSGDPKK